MDSLTEQALDLYNPIAALVVYESNHPHSSQDSYMLESHKILSDGRLGAAKPVSSEFLSKMASTFALKKAQKSPYGILPSNILYADFRGEDGVLCWWSPPQKRTLYFDKKIGLKQGEYNMPGVIYKAIGDALCVYCFNGKKPTARTALLHGPFFNYYEDCHMCLGNSKTAYPSDPTWENLCKYWERLFWDSVNVHTIANPMNRGKILCSELKKSAGAPFDTTTLRKVNITLSKFLEKMERR